MGCVNSTLLAGLVLFQEYCLFKDNCTRGGLQYPKSSTAVRSNMVRENYQASSDAIRIPVNRLNC